MFERLRHSDLRKLLVSVSGELDQLYSLVVSLSIEWETRTRSLLLVLRKL